MKKTLVYLTIGVLLGVVIPLLPLSPYLTPTGITSMNSFSQIREETSQITSFEEDLRFMGLSPLQSGVIHAGMLFAFSFFLALLVYSLSRRRVTTQL